MPNMKSSYVHGGNIQAVAREYSINMAEILDFSANINPLGPPEWLRPCISCSLDTVLHYPDPYAQELKEVIAARYTCDVANVIVANGSTELLYSLPRVLDCKRAVIPVPSYIDYSKVMELAGIPVLHIPLSKKQDFIPCIKDIEKVLIPGDVLILGSPNNPTGVIPDTVALKELGRRRPDVTFLIDEAFLEFVEDGKSLAGSGENIITLHSLTKFYAIPGLRLGFGIFPRSVSMKMQKYLPPWTVNSLAQEVGKRAVLDSEYQKNSRTYFKTCKDIFIQGLSRFTDLHIYPSSANYLFIRLKGCMSVTALAAQLRKKKILIRDCSNYHNLGNNFFRIAVRSEEENEIFLQALSRILFPLQKSFKKQKTPAIMFQGTSSNAGKSVLTAALCRILLQDGVRVAPFKAQNMSLNSYVTHDGLEMGRAQVVQAQAARLDPDVRMNPILLKPNSDTGSQIIVRGKAIGNMGVKAYVKYKKNAMTDACNSYDDLADEFDAIVLEGAGSPGEVNLKRHDIVNMRMARYANSPVILVGDIDRGGVYASFVGTMEVLNHWERALIAGFLVNRFRGDSDLLQDAHDYVKMHTAKDVLGVIPYIPNHGIPEEDSVSFKDGLFAGTEPEQNHIEIVVISLPHISNFTDIEPFVSEPDVFLRIVDQQDDLGDPDVIILPGSKNVIGDLQALVKSGLASKILEKARNGTELVGICGGYQMLGQSIKDPLEIESQQGDIQALSLLNMHTELAAAKVLRRRTGIHISSRQSVVGYEIHHGLTRTDEASLFAYDDHSYCGTASKTDNIWGSYLHGLFDSDSFRRSFINTVRKRKGLGEYKGIQFCYDLEPAFDRLANTVRAGLDMDRVYSLLNL
jgi:cobyric acid synthase CobQ/L-threonine-O-3-phosphate decarboxylase